MGFNAYKGWEKYIETTEVYTEKEDVNGKYIDAYLTLIILNESPLPFWEKKFIG